MTMLFMKTRPKGFLAPDKVDHDGPVFDYIRELHAVLWRITDAVLPRNSGGSLSDYLPAVVHKIESTARSATRKAKKQKRGAAKRRQIP